MSINRRGFITAATASVAGAAVGGGAEQAAGGITSKDIPNVRKSKPLMRALRFGMIHDFVWTPEKQAWTSVTVPD